MKKIPCVLIVGILVALVLPAGCTAPAESSDIPAMRAAAAGIAGSIDRGLEEIRDGLRTSSRDLSATGLAGRAAEEVLAKNLARYPWTLSSWTISPDGIVLAAVPETTAGFVGTNLSGQSHVRKANTLRAPVMSGVFPMVEGFSGMLQTYPVFSVSGAYLGYLDITYAPDVFLAPHIRPVTNRTEYDVRVIQSDGTGISSTRPEETGKNILTDPAYPDPALQALAPRIMQEQSGLGSYTFRHPAGDRNITKTVVWETAGIDGTEWRVVVTREDPSSP